MPNVTTKKSVKDKEQATTTTSQCEEGTSSSAAGVNSLLNTSTASNNSGKARKRKHCEIVRFSDLESEFEDCDPEDAVALETKLRKVARRNSLTHDEMKKLLQKFVKNEHILALVTIKAENELAREKAADDQRAILITHTPCVPKLTRAKARELNKNAIGPLSQLKDTDVPEIANLIEGDLNSDDEDEEYTFKDEDFVSDDDPNTTASDLDSNPSTPQTSAAQTETDASPVKLTEDGCFKVPLVKTRDPPGELRIAERTRSKLCLQQTTIEDIQSEFVPPDLEELPETVEAEVQGLDEDWMQFLTDFTKPLNTNLVGDDDDLINDPEYVAADKVPVDAEELRDVNISKKELQELMNELFGDLDEGLSLENIELETPRKFLSGYQEERLNTSPEKIEEPLEASRQLQYLEEPQVPASVSQPYSCVVTSSDVTQQDMSFHPDVMSTPSTYNNNNCADYENVTLIPVALPNENQNEACSSGSTVTIPTANLNSELEFIALQIPGQPNCFQLAKIVNSDDNPLTPRKQPVEEPAVSSIEELPPKPDSRSNRPYETNYSAFYISLRREAYTEFKEKFEENLKQAQVNQISSTTPDAELGDNSTSGFTKYQYDLLQQQMRTHVQMLTQTYVQTYCHPTLWSLAKKPKEMLMELQAKAQTNNNFNIWNLDKAINLIERWQQELNEDTEENKQMMAFIHREIEFTNHNSRQIPRFHPRIMECFLQSNVFMYPEYLPRMPFTPKVIQYEVFSPVESYLVAMGLEKHVKIINEKKERFRGKSSPLRMACNRLTKDTICGKSGRIVWNHVNRFKNADYYNPIKYYFEHGKAPPVEYTPIIGFENNTVLPPIDRVDELPLVFRKYLEEKNAPPRVTRKHNRKSRANPRVKVSDKFRDSFLEFVREALGEDFFSLPENCKEASQPDVSDSVGSKDSESEQAIKRAKKRKSPKGQSKAKRGVPENFTINVNYVFGAGPITTTTCVTPSVNNTSAAAAAPPFWWNINSSDASLTCDTTQLSVLTQCLQETAANQSVNSESCPQESQPADGIPAVAFNFDLNTQTLKTCNLQTPPNPGNDCQTSSQTDAVTHNDSNRTRSTTDIIECQTDRSLNEDRKGNIKLLQGNRKSQGKRTRIFSNISKLNRYTRRKAVAYREKLRIKQRCEDLITAYGSYLETIQLRFQHAPIIQCCYRKFKALEMYTNILRSLRDICSKNVSSQDLDTSNLTHGIMTSSGNSPGGVKRSRNTSTEDESSPSSQRMARKINRQEENFRHMLLPDTPEETNRKDAIYAFNFYEKVEEAFRSSNRPDDCKKFNTILKSFDPKNDKVSDLYYKLERLFLPDHPELAQVFLTFILPSEAAEIGKFFEHFMINNMATFIDKLNIYFNKQPAQIRKIYNCLNELADDPNVNMKKLETRIVPLLKGNQFLIDWFMQQFPQNAPPERLLGKPEHILNLKEQQSKRTGEYVETLTDLLDSPTNDNQKQQTCQLRYINGRMFYGSKMLLPAKLSFMASSYKDNRVNNQITPPPMPATTCVHAIKEHGEKRLQSASELATVTTITECNDDHERSEEDDVSKQLVIDTTAEEDDSCSSIEACDESTLKAHALRLNPSYYSSSCYSSNATSTPNLNSNFQSHHPNAKKTSLNFCETDGGSGSTVAGKTSPRKHSNQQSSHSPSINTCPSSINSREKRKSPSKKTKSPLNNTTARSVRTCGQPMVVIHETSSAIQCAKRLKSLVESSDSNEESMDTKEHMNIIAKIKSSVKPSVNSNLCSTSFSGVASIKRPEEVKQENSDDLEFLPEHPSVTRSPFPALKMDTDSNEEDVGGGGGRVTKAVTLKLADSQTNTTISTTEPNRSRETKTNAPKLTESQSATAISTTELQKSGETPNTCVPLNAAWTRDEDKIILIEMKLGSQNRQELYQRIAEKLPQRTMCEITDRHQFLMDFLSKLQRK